MGSLPTEVFHKTQPRAFCTGEGSVHSFGLLRFITGMGGIGSFIVCFVLLVEHVGYKVTGPQSFMPSQFTTLVGITVEIPFALGEALLGLEAFYIRCTEPSNF